ncbi:polycystin-1-like protein 2 [Brachyhypopomus gauderio]|uniref:polycystin-1-like protein 2 n=1 Tax=Brachyhypopomus gauderio TaxID=698409 RepID=UPI004041A055
MFRLSLSTLLFGLVLSATAVCGEEDPEGLSCPEHQQAFEGSCYEFVHLQQSFLSSQSWCERGGGHLAFVQNDETQQFLQRHLQPEQNWWLGLAPAFFNLSLDFMEAPLSWLDGSNVSYSNWLGDPVPDTDCGYISASGFQWVTTTNCSQEFYFICQFELGHSLVCPDYNVTLQCDYGYVIQIDHSFYGRKTPYYCQVNESVSPTPFKEECTWVDVGDLISAFCGGLGVCEVATNTSFGEPCPVLGSYLSIKYHCTNVTGHGNSSTTDDNSSWTHHDRSSASDTSSPKIQDPGETPGSAYLERQLHENQISPIDTNSPRTPAPRTTPNDINHGRDSEHDHTPSTDIHSPRTPAPKTTPSDTNHGRDHENDHTPSTDHSPKTPAPKTTPSDTNHDTTTAQLSCAIDPPMGDVLTPFQITCTTVKPFCCSGSCLFCLATFEGDFVLCGSDLGMKFLFLPLGNKSNHYSLGLKVTVKNVDGQAISTALFTQVIDISCDSTVQDLQSVVLNYVTQLQHNGQFSATALAPLFLSVSNSLNRDLNDDLMKSARRKLREVLLADMCAALTYGEPLTFLTEVQMTASTVLSLVTAGDELTYNAQVQACCVLMSISKSQISMLSDGENATVQIIQTAATIVQATSNILQASTNTEQDGITSLVFSILDNVQSSLLTNKEPDQEPIFFSFPPISLYVNRLSPGELPNQTFSFGNRSLAAFTLPPLISNVLPSEKVVDVRMLSFEQNPFSTNKGLPINGTVGSLSITRVNGSVIPVSNLNEEIEILLPLVVAVHLNSTHLDLRNYSTLAINMTTGNTSLVLKLDPSSNISLQLLLGFQMYPNDTNYKAKLQLPQAGKSTEERYTWVLGPRDIALEEGVYYLLVRPVVGAGVNSSNASVFVTSIAAHCLYWDETKTNWSDYGCRVGPRTSASVTQCLCTHLTFFGSSFFVMPNKVDVSRTAELFATFFNNPVVVCFVGAVFLVYILVVIWARWKDLQDKIKVKIMVLEDNDPLSEYRYLLTVSTGHRHGASTSSQVTVTLTGSVWETEPHHLTDPDKLLFERGAVDMFLLTTPFSLGELQSIRLWHDNSGKHPAWYINKVMVQDLETGQKWHFLCSSWLAIDIGECTLDKVFPVATEKDLKGFRNLFFMKTAKDLCDGHIWYSVVSRPPSSNFTCVQRVSCCFSLLLCTMLTSIMFWGIPTNPSEQTMEMGSIKFTWQQVMIGIQSSIIMFPINLLIVSIFRFTRPRKKIQEEESDEQHKPETPPQEKGPCDSFPQWCPQTDITVALIVRDLKRIVRSLAKATRTPIPKEVLGSGKTDISTLLSLVDDIIRQQDFSSGRFWVGDAQNERFSLYSVYQHYLYKQLQNVEKELRLLGPSRFSSPEGYGQAVQQVRGMKGLLEPHLPSSSTRDQSSCGSGPAEDSGGGGRKCCQGGLPWWFVIVGWILVAATSGVSAYFTMMYGLTYGKDRSISWLISTMVSFFESLLITQPIKVLGFAIFFALVVKAVDNDDDDDYINMARDKALTYSDDPDDVRISRRDSTCSFYQPPPSSDVEKMMDNMIKEKKVFALIKEILIYVGFLCTLLITAYGQRDPNAYFLTQHIEQTFSSGISDSMSIKDVLTWANFNLLDNLFGQRPGFITDGKSKLVGSARLRQVRVQKGSCQTAACMRSSVPDCNAPYSWEAEDTGSYGPGWSRSTYSSGAESRLTPWQYQSQSSLRAHPVWGSVAMYRGGGFVVDLGSDLQNASSVLQDLFESMWLDVYTRAVFVEFTVYNANVNLFCIVTLMLETSAVGAFQYRSELQNVRIYQTTDSTYVLVFEVFYFLFILYYMFLQCKRLKQHKWKYFKSKGNLLELTIILLSWSALSMFIKKTVQGEQELKYYQGHKDQFPSFYETASADAVLGYIVAFLVLLASIKLCHLLRFNSRLKWFTSTLWRAWNDIANLFVIIIVVLLAYSLACNLLFGWKLYTYKTLIDAIMAMVSLQLGMFNYDEVLDLSPVLGTFIIVSFVTFMTFIVLNIFISVILKAFSLERQNHEPSEEEEVVDLMLKKTSNFFGIKTQKK